MHNVYKYLSAERKGVSDSILPNIALHDSHSHPQHTIRWINVGVILLQHYKRYASITPVLGQCLVFAACHPVSVINDYYAGFVYMEDQRGDDD